MPASGIKRGAGEWVLRSDTERNAMRFFGPQKYQPDLLVDTEHAVMPHVMLRGSGVESSKAAMQIGYQQKRAARTSATSHPGPPEPLARCGVRSGLLR